MSVHHDMIVRSLFYGIQVVVYHPLVVVVVAFRNDVPDISGFHGIIAVFPHKLVCGIQLPLVIPDG